MSKDGVKKVVLAYSGGLDTSVIIQWLLETYQCPVVAFVADVGQGEDLEAVRQKALKTGASKIYIEDLKKEFAEDRRITIGEVAEAGGIHRMTLSKMINQKGYNTGTENLDRLCAYFDCRLEDLVEYVSAEQI